MDARRRGSCAPTSARARIPLVMISGYDADNLPANDGLWDHYLGKPCPPEELVSVIGRLVA